MNRPPPRYKLRWTAPRHHDYPFTPPCVHRHSRPAPHICELTITPTGDTLILHYGDSDMPPETLSRLLQMTRVFVRAVREGWQGESDNGPPERVGAFGEPTEGAVL